MGWDVVVRVTVWYQLKEIQLPPSGKDCRCVHFAKKPFMPSPLVCRCRRHLSIRRHSPLIRPRRHRNPSRVPSPPPSFSSDLSRLARSFSWLHSSPQILSSRSLSSGDLERTPGAPRRPPPMTAHPRDSSLSRGYVISSAPFGEGT